jgi:hypothetical protein
MGVFTCASNIQSLKQWGYGFYLPEQWNHRQQRFYPYSNNVLQFTGVSPLFSLNNR